MRHQTHLEIEIDRDEFRKKLGIEDLKVDEESIANRVLNKIPVVDEDKISKSITKKVLKKIPQPDTMNQMGFASGGANQLVIQNNGVRLSDYFLNLNFGPGLTSSYSNGTILVTANTSGAILTATGTINDTNTQFTFTQLPSVLIINGGTYKQAGGSITWAWDAGTLTATLSTPVGSLGSIFGQS